ncbi:amidohydrolase [Bacillus sp. JJ1764]|uniref:amidohydrolase n=1 Tax=Bacillus sp. JJ1764 TaxID=3122964 RepID=UPI003000B01B
MNKTESKYADLILVSNCIFSAKPDDESPVPGIVAITGNKIAAVASKSEIGKWAGPETTIYELGDQLVCPGFLDNHVFFTGYAWTRAGVDCSGASSSLEVLEMVKSYSKTIPQGKTLVGHGLNVEGWSEQEKTGRLLDEVFGDRPVAIFTPARDFCFMNRAAEEKYGFTKDECYAEACWKLLKEILSDREQMAEEYREFSHLLASRGITSIKEIGFDDYSGFSNILANFAETGELIHRVNLVSQPVAEEINFNYGESCRERFTGDSIKFMGYNLMADGEIASFNGDMLEPYTNKPDTCNQSPVNYEAIGKSVLEADRRGFRCALHAEGDAAVRKSIDIFENCMKNNGKRDARHTIIDLEMIHPIDIKRMADLDITATNYVQIMNGTGRYEDFYGPSFVGEHRLKQYWAYRSMIDEGVNICCGTDLPLDTPNIPLSIYHAVGRRFPDGKPEQGFNKEQGMSIAENLRAWTIGGQYVNFEDQRLGTLEAGKFADIAVLNQNVFAVPMEEMRNVKVALTLYNGRVVYQVNE